MGVTRLVESCGNELPINETTTAAFLPSPHVYHASRSNNWDSSNSRMLLGRQPATRKRRFGSRRRGRGRRGRSRAHRVAAPRNRIVSAKHNRQAEGSTDGHGQTKQSVFWLGILFICLFTHHYTFTTTAASVVVVAAAADAGGAVAVVFLHHHRLQSIEQRMIP